MDTIRSEKLHQVVFERLTAGESPEALRQELVKRMDDASARHILDDAMRRIADDREKGDYDKRARGIRVRRFAQAYVAWKTLGFVLLVIGVAASLSNSSATGSLSVAFGPLAIGVLILITIDIRVNGKIAEAKEAVDALFGSEAGPA